MDKNKKSAIFLVVMAMLCIAMLFVYMNFLNDRKAAEQQNQQVLSPDQMVNGVKQFINDTTSNIKPLPVKP